jgi:hypothetical protein
MEINGTPADVETITKTAAAAEVLKQQYKIKNLSIAGVVISLLVLSPAIVGDGAAFLVVGAGCLLFGYFFITTNKEIDRLRLKYKL